MAIHHEAGKGSVARPLSVDEKQFAANWDAIFGKKSAPSKTEQQPVNNRLQEQSNERNNQDSSSTI